jgi:hypothetical protein
MCETHAGESLEVPVRQRLPSICFPRFDAIATLLRMLPIEVVYKNRSFRCQKAQPMMEQQCIQAAVTEYLPFN